MPLIESSITDHIARIAFDHDARRNALGTGMIAEVLAELDRFKTEKAHVVVLRSAKGGKVW